MFLTNGHSALPNGQLLVCRHYQCAEHHGRCVGAETELRLLPNYANTTAGSARFRLY